MPRKTSKPMSPPPVIVRKKAKKQAANTAGLQPAPPSSAAAERDVQPQPALTPQPVAVPVPQAVPEAPRAPVEDTAPQATSPNRRQRDAQAKWQLLTVLQERWPVAFPRQASAIRPLAVGIHKALAAALPGTPPWHIKGAIALFQRLHKGAYWRVVIKGGSRYDLDGQPCSAVTAEEQELARQALAAFQAWRAAQRRQPETGQ